MKKRNLWTILSILCALAAFFFFSQLFSIRAEEKQAQNAYSNLRITTPETITEPSDASAATDESVSSGIDLSSLTKLDDFVFWLDIPGTPVSYPVMQYPDNTYYLNHLPDGTKNRTGSLFLDSYNERNLSSPNTVIYGHNMKDGSMFAELLKYKDPDFLASHRDVWVITKDGAWQYEIVSAHIVKDTADCYRLSFNGEWQEWLTKETGQSSEDSRDIEHVFTFSTCTGWPKDERMVLHAIPINHIED